jgi:phage tail-like protein
MPETGGRVDPYKNFRFLVEIDSITQAGFRECSGFGSSIEVVSYREGGETPTVRKLPGQVTYNDITLRWGITDSRELYDWHRDAVNGQIRRLNGSIILQDDVGEEVVRWNFENAWPSSWEGASFDATASDVAIDALTVVCEKVERA